VKIKLTALLALGVLVCVAAFWTSAPAVSKAAVPSATVAISQPETPAVPNAAAVPEPHPEIHRAIDSLHHAKDHLEHAAHDFGGHRVDAIHAIDEAIRQLEICLKYD
jgi:hypothetical protein